MNSLKLYLDESGSLADDLPFTIVVVFGGGKHSIKRLSRLPKKIRQKIMNKELREKPELKFNDADEVTRRRYFEFMIKYGPKIFAIAVDKEGRKIDDTPINYALIVGTLLTKAFPKRNLELIIDKKYTRQKSRDEFDSTLKWITSYSKIKLKKILHLKGTQEKLIITADFAAGALLHKYSYNNLKYYEIIRGGIEKEEVIKWREIKAKAERKRRKSSI